MTNNVQDALLIGLSEVDISDGIILVKRSITRRYGPQADACWLDLQSLLNDALEKAIACECEEPEKPEEEPEDIQIL